MEKKDPPHPHRHLLHEIDPERHTSSDDFNDADYQQFDTLDFDEEAYDPDELLHYFNRYPQSDKDFGRQRQADVHKRRIKDFGLKPNNWVK